MSKTLAIVRHGKSTWDYDSISDLDRPLKEVGIANTLMVAKKLKDRKIVPGLIISSPAVRAMHTALIISRELHYPQEKIKITPDLYSDSEDKILDIIKSTDNATDSLFIFGHNPSFTILANLFLKNQIENIPTSGTVIFEFSITNWSDISKKKVQSEIRIFPKD